MGCQFMIELPEADPELTGRRLCALLRALPAINEELSPDDCVGVALPPGVTIDISSSWSGVSAIPEACGSLHTELTDSAIDREDVLKPQSEPRPKETTGESTTTAAGKILLLLLKIACGALLESHPLFLSQGSLVFQPKGFQHCQAPRANSGRGKAWEAA